MDNFQWRNIFKQPTPIYKSEKRNRLSPLIQKRVNYFEDKIKKDHLTSTKIINKSSKNKPITPKILKNVPEINKNQTNIVIKLVYPEVTQNFKSLSESLPGKSKKEVLRKSTKHQQPIPVPEEEKKIVIADVIRKLFNQHNPPASPRPKYIVKSIVKKIESKMSIRNLGPKQPLLTRSMRSNKSILKSPLIKSQIEYFETIQKKLIEKSNKFQK